MKLFAAITLVLAALAAGGSAATVLQQNRLQDDVLSNDPVHTTESWDWNDCGTDSTLVTISSIKITPDPPQKGQNLTVTVAGTAKDTVEEGAWAEVAVKIGAIRILKKEIDICEEARNADLDVQCPLNKGDYTVVQEVTLPKEIPPGKFKVEVRGYTVDDEDLACVDIDVDFRKKFPRIW